MAIYFDRFSQEYTIEINSYAAPERYYQLSYFKENFDDNIDECVEVWKLENLDNAYVTYDKELLSSPNLINKLRDKIFNEHNSMPLYMTEWIIPKDMYDAILQEVE